MGGATKSHRAAIGLSEGGARHILDKLIRRFLWVSTGTVLFGFLISYLSARRTLLRVERITETVAQIGSQELDERLPEQLSSDEISRLANTFNHMLGRILVIFAWVAAAS